MDIQEVSFPKDFSTAAERLERLCVLAVRENQTGVAKAFVTEGIYIVARLTFGAIRDLAYSGGVFAKNMVVLDIDRAFLDASKYLSSSKAGFVWAINMVALPIIGLSDPKKAIFYSNTLIAVDQLGEGVFNRMKQVGRLSVLAFKEYMRPQENPRVAQEKAIESTELKQARLQLQQEWAKLGQVNRDLRDPRKG